MAQIEGPVTLDEIIQALKQLGGEAQAVDIKDQVTLNRGGMPSHYSNEHSYRETIQRIIENNCPESDNYQGTTIFKKVVRGRYRLVEGY
ncbi:MAG TPA: hypothetical protein VGE07_10995 [Herpetosiphonaceae bacterium]